MQADLKERIIEAATALIQEKNGEAEAITTRAIAERAGVGVGLINYHFQTKEKLIAICVERIIGQVILHITPTDAGSSSGKERIAGIADEVLKFLLENPAISRISILGDFSNPSLDDNTARSQKGLRNEMGEAETGDFALLSFVLVSAIQVAFLNRAIGEVRFGYRIELEDERREFVHRLVDLLLPEPGAQQ